MRLFFYAAIVFIGINQAIFSREAYENEKHHNYQIMDTLALNAGTDKSSAFHNYTSVYSKYFDKIKNDRLVFLEIGIYKGDSVKLWENYFPNADLHFIDITSEYIQYNSTRSHYHFLNQKNVLALEALGKDVGPFDIIIDDGGHTMTQQITSFKALFPFVKPGGMYVIEDLHTSYWNQYGGIGSFENPIGGKGTTVGFLQELVDSVNFVGASTECADFDKANASLLSRMTKYQKHIESIHFHSSLCIIIKR